jgi:hypothetical protein
MPTVVDMYYHPGNQLLGQANRHTKYSINITLHELANIPSSHLLKLF